MLEHHAHELSAPQRLAREVAHVCGKECASILRLWFSRTLRRGGPERLDTIHVPHDPTVPPDLQLWVWEIDTILSRMGREYIDGAFNPRFVHPRAADILVGAHVLDERFDDIADAAGIPRGRLRSVLDAATFAFVCELRSRDITREIRPAPECGCPPEADHCGAGDRGERCAMRGTYGDDDEA